MPSITGIAASGPMSPRPSTAVPSLTTATVFALIVRFQAASRRVGDGAADPRHPGCVGHREVVARLQRHLGRDLELPTEVHEEGAVGDVQHLDAVERARRPSTMRCRCSSSAAATVTSRTLWSLSARTRSIAPSDPPASAIACASRANEPGASASRTRIVAENDAERWLTCGSRPRLRGLRSHRRRSLPHAAPRWCERRRPAVPLRAASAHDRARAAAR